MNNILYGKSDKFSLTEVSSMADNERYLVFSGPEPNVHICIEMYYDKYDEPAKTAVPELQAIEFGAKFRERQDIYTLDLNRYRTNMIMPLCGIVATPSLAETADLVFKSNLNIQERRVLYSFDHIKYDVEVLIDWNCAYSRYLPLLAAVLRNRNHAKFSGNGKTLKATFANSSVANYWMWKIEALQSLQVSIRIIRIDAGITDNDFAVSYSIVSDNEVKTEIVDDTALNSLLAVMAYLAPPSTDMFYGYNKIVRNYMRNVDNLELIREYPYINPTSELHTKILVDDEIVDFNDYSSCPGKSSGVNTSLDEWKRALTYFLGSYGFTGDKLSSVKAFPRHYRASERLMMTRCICDVEGATCIRHSGPIPLPENATYSMKYLHWMLYADRTRLPTINNVSMFERGCYCYNITPKKACSDLVSVIQTRSIADMIHLCDTVDTRYAWMC